MSQQMCPRKMLVVGGGLGKAQYVHNATVVRSHSAVLVVAVEIEWARRLSGVSQAAMSERDPGEEDEEEGGGRMYYGVVDVVLCCCRAKSLHVGMERRSSLVGEEGSVMRQGGSSMDY